ncbi:hypothetical protein E4K64_33410 [Bradyrhizobium frederickii]|uniref:Uncharacterized protein n=1 Tax=Bradyrhizobium frederickii TaxID=2560054 RepID=A0A4Y9NNN5_9BRAD|nr:hypothetical protein [Bradyrhizobium frederickii]TFV69431.1 hypothetical protein E4K64_33410 [Bradyrhizobium frederickii]
MEIIRELPADSTRATLSGLALQQRERETSLQSLARLRKEASAEIERLIAFLDASDPYVTTELEDDISADLEGDDPAEEDDPAENDLDDEPSLGSFGTGEWQIKRSGPPAIEPTLRTSTMAPNRTRAASLTWRACLSRWARKAGNWTGTSDATQCSDSLGDYTRRLSP